MAIFENRPGSESPRDETPFREALEKSEVAPDDKLQQIEGVPEKILRSRPLENLPGQFPRESYEPLGAAGRFRELYSELQEKYSIRTPVDFVIGKDEEGRKALYAITDRIAGVTLNAIQYDFEHVDEREKEHFVRELGELYRAWARYLYDKYRNNGDFLWDITANRQYIYGKRSTDSESHIYLVDTDLGWVAYAQEKNQSWFLSATDGAIHGMSAMEDIFGVRFDAAREKFNNLFSHMSDKEISLHPAIRRFVMESGREGD